MSAISENIPRHLLKTVAEDESTKTILIEDKSTKKSASKKKKDDKPVCKAAAKHQTIHDALVAMTEKKFDVFIIREPREEDPSKIKETGYSRCTISALAGKEYCHHHDDCKNLKIFDIDILPRSEDDLERRQAITKDDPYFKEMGKRGARKKAVNEITILKEKNNPLSIILRNEDNQFAAELIELMKISFELLKNKKYNNKPGATASTTEVVKKTRGRPPKATETPTTAAAVAATTVVEKTESNDVEDENQDVDFGSDDDADADAKAETNQTDEKVDNDEGEEDSDEAEEDEDDDEVELTTMCGKTITYVISENEVYDPSDIDDEGAATWIGSFYEIDQKYANIKYNEKNYGIFSKHTCNVNDKPFEFYRCPLNNNAFDMNKNFVGKYVEKNGKFEIEFAKKKTTKK